MQPEEGNTKVEEENNYSAASDIYFTVLSAISDLMNLRMRRILSLSGSVFFVSIRIDISLDSDSEFNFSN